MRVAILGPAGGMGAYLGARLAHAGAAGVHLVARGSHLEALRRSGLGRRSEVGVPANEAIYALLSPWTARNRARSAKPENG